MHVCELPSKYNASINAAQLECYTYSTLKVRVCFLAQCVENALLLDEMSEVVNRTSLLRCKRKVGGLDLLARSWIDIFRLLRSLDDGLDFHRAHDPGSVAQVCSSREHPFWLGMNKVCSVADTYSIGDGILTGSGESERCG